jgi:hypothetical protein
VLLLVPAAQLAILAGELRIVAAKVKEEREDMQQRWVTGTPSGGGLSVPLWSWANATRCRPAPCPCPRPTAMCFMAAKTPEHHPSFVLATLISTGFLAWMAHVLDITPISAPIHTRRGSQQRLAILALVCQSQDDGGGGNAGL